MKNSKQYPIGFGLSAGVIDSSECKKAECMRKRRKNGELVILAGEEVVLLPKTLRLLAKGEKVIDVIHLSQEDESFFDKNGEMSKDLLVFEKIPTQFLETENQRIARYLSGPPDIIEIN